MPASPPPALRRLLAGALAALVVLAVAACSDDTVEEGASTGGESLVEVTLEEPGASPRQRLRLSFEEGQVVRTAVTMKTGIQMEVDGEPLPIAVPGSRVVMRTTVESVDDGTARVGFVYDDALALPEAGVNPAALEGVGVALAQVKGLKGSVTLDRRGGASDAKVDTRTIDNEAVRTSVETMASQYAALSVPFPAEPVGVGAVWKATRRAKANGVVTDTTTTYTLRSLRGSDYELEVSQQVTAPRGPAAIPGLGSGVDAEIVSYEVTNAGTVSGSLGSPLPATSAIKGGGDVRMKVSDGASSSDLLQHMTIDVQSSPA